MKVVLLEHTPNPDHLAVTAARQCYAAGFVGESYKDKKIKEKDKELLRKVIGSGHLSTIEHISFTFAIEGISRAASHQLVRHRVASFSQQSQRYVAFDIGKGFPYIIPETVKGAGFGTLYKNLMYDIDSVYHRMLEAGIPAEDARYVLPNATETDLVMTMNARELLHTMSLRTCVLAQWEIREMFGKIREIVKEIAPVMFEKCGPTCETEGICREGARSCGRLRKV